MNLKATLTCLLSVAVATIACSADDDGTSPLPAGITSFRLSDAFCGAPIDECRGRHDRSVNLDSKTFEVARCVEVGKGIAVQTQRSSRPLGDDELERLRVALRGVRTVDATSNQYDGMIVSLEVNTPDGASTFMAEGGCSPSAYRKIASGLADLRSALDALESAD